MNKVAIATCGKEPFLQPSDALLARALEARGCDAAPAPWNGPFEAFAGADLVVVRSTWDYPRAAAAFRAWLAALGEISGHVANAPALMVWNLEKTYLFDLAAKGAPLPPTIRADPAPAAIAAAMDALGLAEAVVKPIIGATASGLSVVRRDDPESLGRAASNLGFPALVQPLLGDIRSRGETSLIYFGGVFSHAVVKRPKAGSILSQSDHGGGVERASPPAWAIDAGRRVLDLLPEAPHYARVDVVILDESVLLMEVELIEPELFLTHDDHAAARFADVLMKELDA